jgi:L,D-transpeptidase-like protein
MKKTHTIFLSLFILALHLPFTFAKVISSGACKTNILSTSHSTSNPATGNWLSTASSVYDSLRLGSMGLTKQAFEYAYKGFTYLKEIGKIENDAILSIVDFSKPSSEKRLFIIDLQNAKVLFNTYVAHGMKSGKEFANKFSNSLNSYKSSLGFYETESTYNGKNGYSLHLMGLERGINDNAYRREIVMHGAQYVNEDMIHAKGYIGRSWGCPAIPEELHVPIIDQIKNGTCLFIFSPDKNYIKRSKILKEASSPLLAYNR